VWIIQTNLTARGYEVITAPDGQSAVEAAATQKPALILLDVKMPYLDGFQACRQIRDFSTAPIIMLTAKAEHTDKIKGLDAGADDYVTKPFNIDELLARVRSNLRRVKMISSPKEQSDFEACELKVDFNKQRVFLADQEVHLTATEYKLLNELTQKAGQVVDSDYLLDKIWGPGYEAEYRMLRQVVYRLRQKIEQDTKNPQFIQTRSGLGYIFVLPD
jgi:DNA-binding response OmpR family regulator